MSKRKKTMTSEITDAEIVKAISEIEEETGQSLSKGLNNDLKNKKIKKGSGKKIKKGSGKKIKKSLDDDFNADEVQKAIEVSEVLKAFDSKIESTSNRNTKILANLAILQKANMETLNELTAKIDKMPSRLIKSVTGKIDPKTLAVKDKFKKGVEDNLNENSIGLRSNRNEIFKALDNLAFKDDGEIDMKYVQAIQKFEHHKTIDQSILKAVEENLGTTIDINN